MTLNWGKLKHFQFEKHKKCSPIHLQSLSSLIQYIENLKKSAIPDAINFRNRSISVTIDGEQSKSRCGYYRETDHKIEDCNKRVLNETRKQAQEITDQNSYATKLLSTIKPREIIQHSSTILKIRKKAIEKKLKLFPTISRKHPYKPSYLTS